MIMNNRKNMFEETGWEKMEVKAKKKVYNVMHELLQTQVCTPFFYKLLILIEFLQMFYFSIHKNYHFLFKTDFLEYLRQIVQYFQVNYILTLGNKELFLVLLYITVALKFIMMLFYVFVIWKGDNTKRSSTFLIYAQKILSFYALIFVTIGVIPFFNCLIATLLCNNNSPNTKNFDCYSGIYFMHFAFAIISIIFLIFFALLFTILYVDINPASNIPFAAPQSRVNLYKLVLKIILPFYFTVDYDRSIPREFAILLTFLYLLLLILRYRSFSYYDTSIQNWVVVCESLLAWSTLVTVIHALLDFDYVDDTGLLYLFVASPFICYTVIIILRRRDWKLLKTPLKNMKKDEEIESYVLLLLRYIENRENAGERIILEGVLKLHIKYCNKSTDHCNCVELSNEAHSDESTVNTKTWYQFLKFILKDSIDRFNKSSRLHILSSYIHQEKLKNKYKAMYELMLTEENKPNIQEEFSIFRFKFTFIYSRKLIEDEMMEAELLNNENKSVDVMSVVFFQKKYEEFLVAIGKSVNLHTEFWRELLEEKPDIQKLQNLGSKITNSIENVMRLNKKLAEVNSNNIKCLEIFGNFLRDVVNDDIEGSRIIEKSEYIAKSAVANKQFLDSEKAKYGDNSNTLVIMLSGNYNSIGMVVNCNYEISRLLGFNKSEVIGQNISRILPKVFHDLHDSFIRRFMETSESSAIGVERLVFPMKKSGYIIPCSILIKVIPNLDEGIQIIGFLKEIEIRALAARSMMNTEENSEDSLNYMIYSPDTGLIHGITEGCYSGFGIPSMLVYGYSSNTNDFSLDAICPDLMAPENQEELRSANGIVVNIDTSTIPQNYLMGQNDTKTEMKAPGEEKDLDEEQTEKMRKYRKTRIRAFMVMEKDFGDVKLNIVRFNDAEENNEKKSYSQAYSNKQYTNENQTNQEIEYDDKEENMNSENRSNISGAISIIQQPQ